MRLNDDDAVIMASVAVLAAAWWWKNRPEHLDGMTMAAPVINLESFTGFNFDLGDTVENIKNKLWIPPAGAAPYLATIRNAEIQYSLPENMLARLLYQESHYRPEIINGTKKSSAGALGIAQFMPATAKEMGIDPLDPNQAIPAAAKYLKGLYNRFGNWQEALAAYNWGQGNVSRKGIDQAPTETRNYFSEILADLGLA